MSMFENDVLTGPVENTLRGNKSTDIFALQPLTSDAKYIHEHKKHEDTRNTHGKVTATAKTLYKDMHNIADLINKSFLHMTVEPTNGTAYASQYPVYAALENLSIESGRQLVWEITGRELQLLWELSPMSLRSQSALEKRLVGHKDSDKMATLVGLTIPDGEVTKYVAELVGLPWSLSQGHCLRTVIALGTTLELCIKPNDVSSWSFSSINGEATPITKEMVTFDLYSDTTTLMRGDRDIMRSIADNPRGLHVPVFTLQTISKRFETANADTFVKFDSIDISEFRNVTTGLILAFLPDTAIDGTAMNTTDDRETLIDQFGYYTKKDLFEDLNVTVNSFEMYKPHHNDFDTYHRVHAWDGAIGRVPANGAYTIIPIGRDIANITHVPTSFAIPAYEKVFISGKISVPSPGTLYIFNWCMNYITYSNDMLGRTWM